MLFILIISCCSGGGSIKQESPDTDPSQTSGGSSKQESSDTDPSRIPGKNRVKNRLGQSLLVVLIDSSSFLFLLFTFLL